MLKLGSLVKVDCRNFPGENWKFGSIIGIDEAKSTCKIKYVLGGFGKNIAFERISTWDMMHEERENQQQEQPHEQPPIEHAVQRTKNPELSNKKVKLESPPPNKQASELQVDPIPVEIFVIPENDSVKFKNLHAFIPRISSVFDQEQDVLSLKQVLERLETHFPDQDECMFYLKTMHRDNQILLTKEQVWRV